MQARESFSVWDLGVPESDQRVVSQPECSGTNPYPYTPGVTLMLRKFTSLFCVAALSVAFVGCEPADGPDAIDTTPTTTPSTTGTTTTDPLDDTTDDTLPPVDSTDSTDVTETPVTE